MNYRIISITLLIAGQICFTQNQFDPETIQKNLIENNQVFNRQAYINKAPMKLNFSAIHTPNDSYNLKPRSNTSNKMDDIALIILNCAACALPITSICENKKVSLLDGCSLVFFIINIAWNGRVYYKKVQKKEYTQNFSKNLENSSKKIRFTRS